MVFIAIIFNLIGHFSPLNRQVSYLNHLGLVSAFSWRFLHFHSLLALLGNKTINSLPRECGRQVCDDGVSKPYEQLNRTTAIGKEVVWKLSDDLDKCWISNPIYAYYTLTDVLKKAFSRIGICAFNVYIDGIGIFAGDKLYWLWHTAEQHSIMIGIARLLKIVIINLPSSFYRCT